MLVMANRLGPIQRGGPMPHCCTINRWHRGPHGKLPTDSDQLPRWENTSLLLGPMTSQRMTFFLFSIPSSASDVCVASLMNIFGVPNNFNWWFFQLCQPAVPPPPPPLPPNPTHLIIPSVGDLWNNGACVMIKSAWCVKTHSSVCNIISDFF